MKLDDLQQTEKLALVGLARILIRADGEFSREEAQSLTRISEELGAEQFWQLNMQAAEIDDEQIKQYARDVVRIPVRELIYGTLYEIAVAGMITDAESDMLDWLSDLWGMAAQIDPYRS